MKEYKIETPIEKFPQLQSITRPKYKQGTDSRKNITKQNTVENRMPGQELFGAGVGQEIMADGDAMRDNFGRKSKNNKHHRNLT